jgi:hypothetical protein
MRRSLLLVLIALAFGCAPRLRFNQSFLVSEELKVARSGFVSLKSTGESFDFAPIAAREPGAKRVVVIKTHGNYLLTGDGFRHLWRLWPSGEDQVGFEAVSLDAGPEGFLSPTLEMSGDCVLVRWQERQAFVTADGDSDAHACPD